MTGNKHIYMIAISQKLKAQKAKNPAIVCLVGYISFNNSLFKTTIISLLKGSMLDAKHPTYIALKIF